MKIDLVNFLKANSAGQDLLALKEYLPLKLQNQMKDINESLELMSLLYKFDISDIDDDK